MPLKKGKSKAAFKQNVEELRATGHKLRQALAIAFKEQRKAGGRG